jgi:alcohol dehydrogenase class IV
MSAAALDFVYASPPARVLLGPDQARKIDAELDLLGLKRVLFVCSPSGEGRYAPIIDTVGSRCAGVFAQAEPHCPERVAAAALDAFDAARSDGVLAVGGGSTIGLGKYIAARRKAPLLAVPTTLSGSEMTALFGVKIGNEKRTWNDMTAKPRTVIYDPVLTATLPKHETATTGMNCLAHCVEALYPAQPNPIAHMLALEGIRSLAAALPGVIERNDIEARSRALYAGFLGGMLVSMVGIGLHHKICHILGGRFGVPHGESNSVILPYVVAFNAPAMPDVAADIAQALGSSEAAVGISDLGARIGAPSSLRALGLPRGDLDAAAQEIVAKGTHNPRPITVENIHRLLTAAWEGHLPAPNAEQQARRSTVQGGYHAGIGAS